MRLRLAMFGQLLGSVTYQQYIFHNYETKGNDDVVVVGGGGGGV